MGLPLIVRLTSHSPSSHAKLEMKGHLGMAISTIFGILVTATLLIRLYTRKWLTRGFGLDDVFIIFAYFPATAFTIMGIVAEKQVRWSNHKGGPELSISPGGLKIVFTNDILFDLATSLTKLSILILIHRLTTASRDRNVTIAVWISMGVISVNCFLFIIVSFCQCIPLSDLWDISDGPKNCINRSSHAFAASVINTTTDWVVVLLPVWMAMGLNLPIRQVGMVVFLFGLGILASSAGIARSYSIWKLFYSGDIWDRWAVWIASVTELNLGIICASVPAMKPFFATYLPETLKIFRHHTSTTIRNGLPLSCSTSLTTFIDRSSSSSFLLRHLAPLRPGYQRVNLNKPLPAIVTHRYSGLEMQPGPEADPNESCRSPQTPSRVYYRADISPSNLRPRDWILIMYQENSDPGPIQPIPDRAELP
ncbi:hypothetical protein F5Y11DRAFT_116799 [Daldinia sp. FL1419]|nr:hypothetical protein F5Y11DRAFT_116799 [Daldinia sp. FL1419]